MPELTDNEKKVLTYLHKTPNATARDIAREVFGGSGDSRTGERARAHRVLIELENLKLASRYRPDDNSADRWKAKATAMAMATSTEAPATTPRPPYLGRPPSPIGTWDLPVLLEEESESSRVFRYSGAWVGLSGFRAWPGYLSGLLVDGQTRHAVLLQARRGDQDLMPVPGGLPMALLYQDILPIEWGRIAPGEDLELTFRPLGPSAAFVLRLFVHLDPPGDSCPPTTPS